MNTRSFFQHLLWLCLSVSPAYAVTVEHHEVQPTLSLRGQVMAKNTKSIINRINLPMILDIVPDGSFVKEGDVLIRFDEKNLHQQLENMRHTMEVIQIKLKQKLHDIDDELMKMEEQLSSKKSDDAVLRAQRERLLSIPLQDDIEAAQGVLDISKLNLQAAEKVHLENQKRYQKEMISLAKLNESKASIKRERAKLERDQIYLELTELPSTRRRLKINELQIKNSELEIEKLSSDLIKKNDIAKINKETAKRRQKGTQREIDSLLEELKHITLKAPIDGVVRYTPGFILTMTQGAKPHKMMALMEIPDLSALHIKTYIPESHGSFFKEADLAKIYLTGHLKPLAGKINNVQSNPTDLSEFSSSFFDQGKSSGIKFFIAFIALKETSSQLKVGTWLNLDLTSHHPISGPAIGIEHLRIRQEQAHLPKEGIFVPVQGVSINGTFFIEDESWLHTELDDPRHCQYPEQGVGLGQQLKLMGELTPREAIEIRVPKTKLYHRSLKITWLEDEYKEVKSGDVIIKIESEETNKKVKEVRDSIQKIKGELDALLKEQSLKRNNHLHRKTVLNNKIIMAQLEKEILELSGDAVSQIDSDMNLKTSQLDLEQAERNLQKLISQKQFTSTSSIQERQRKRDEANIQHHISELNLKKAMMGPTRVEKLEAEIKLERLRFEQLNLTHEQRIDQQEMKNSHDSTHKVWSKEKKRLRVMEEDTALFEIRSPQAGFLRYAKVWDGMSMSKIRPNVGLWREQKLMTLANNSSMNIQLKIPEQYYSKIKMGMDVSISISSAGVKHLKGKVDHIKSFFKPQKRQDAENVGPYSEQEQLGYNYFEAVILLNKKELTNYDGLKAGTMAEVTFPFD